MNDIFLDLRDVAGNQIFVNARNIVAIRVTPDGSSILTVTGEGIFVEESPADIYTTILGFQDRYSIHVIQ